MKMLSLHESTLLLIDLQFTLHWTSSDQDISGSKGETSRLCTQRFPPIAFAAPLITEPSNPSLFLQSLDAACLARVQSLTKYTMYAFTKPVHYEVERAFVFAGLEDARLPIRGLTAAELESQLALVRERGLRDVVRVDMAVEIEAGEELREKGWDVKRGPEGWKVEGIIFEE